MKRIICFVIVLIPHLMMLSCSVKTPSSISALNSIVCDEYSQLGKDYYEVIKSNTPNPIAKMVLTLPTEDGAMAKLVVKKKLNKKYKKNISIANTKYGPSMAKGPYTGDYVLLLIPPLSAATNFKQLDQADRPIPLYLAIPKKSFKAGECHIYRQPFVISSIEQEVDPGIGQLVLPVSELKRITKFLFLKEELILDQEEILRSNDISSIEAIKRIISIFIENKAVDMDTWGGYVSLKVKRKSRNIFDWFVDNKFGKPSTNLDGISYGYYRYSSPKVDEIISEYQMMENQWENVLAEYGSRLERFYLMVKAAKDSLNNSSQFKLAYQNAAEQLVEMNDYIETQYLSLKFQKGYFVTDYESDYYIKKLNIYFQSGVDIFNSIASEYLQSLKIENKRIPVDLIMNPASVANAGPVVWDGLQYHLSDIGATVFGKGSAFVTKSGDHNNNVINLYLLLDLNQSINSLKEIARAKIYSHSSCSKLVQGFTQNGPRINDNTVLTSFNAPILLRVCGSYTYPCWRGWKTYRCRKHFKTNVGRTSVNVNSYAEIVNTMSTIDDETFSDICIDYGYNIAANIFNLGHKYGRTDGLIRKMKTNDKFEDFFSYNPTLIESAVGHADDKKNYVVLSFQTDELDDNTTSIILDTLRSKLDELIITRNGG